MQAVDVGRRPGERLLVVSAASELRLRGLLRQVQVVADAGLWASLGTLGRLDALSGVDGQVERVRSALVARARVEGSSWRLVAAAVGGTPRAMRDRYGSGGGL